MSGWDWLIVLALTAFTTLAALSIASIILNTILEILRRLN